MTRRTTTSQRRKTTQAAQPAVDDASKTEPMEALEPARDRRAKERRNNTSIIQLMRKSRDSGERRRTERRATPRLKVEIECEETAEGARYFRITDDLSTFGLSTRQGGHPKGTKLKLTLHLKDAEKTPLELDAKVVGAYDRGAGMRLKFRNPSVRALRRIHRYLIARGLDPDHR